MRRRMLSILIVNWNTRDLLAACLASIRRFPPREAYEVIVVDNASSDGSAEMVRSDFPEAKLIEPGQNLGYAAGNNEAMSAASGEWLLTLNPDTEFVDDSLQRAIELMAEHPTFGALGAKLIDPPSSSRPSSVQHSVRGFPSVIGLIGMALHLDRLFPRSRLGSYSRPDFDYESAGPAPQPMGTFLLFRREALAAVANCDPMRPFDEGFPIFFNEVDLLKRMAKAGWPALFSPEVVVVHHGGQSTRQVRPAMIWESHRSLHRYLWKHSAPWVRWTVYPGFVAASWLAAFVRARGWNRGFRP